MSAGRLQPTGVHKSNACQLRRASPQFPAHLQLGSPHMLQAVVCNCWMVLCTAQRANKLSGIRRCRTTLQRIAKTVGCSPCSGSACAAAGSCGHSDGTNHDAKTPLSLAVPSEDTLLPRLTRLLRQPDGCSARATESAKELQGDNYAVSQEKEYTGSVAAAASRLQMVVVASA